MFAYMRRWLRLRLRKNFKPGDMLRIRPVDNDDPVTIELAGRRCRFVQYIAGSLMPGCQVQLSTKGKPIAMREKDLEKE